MQKLIRIILSVAIVGTPPAFAQTNRAEEAIESSGQMRVAQIASLREKIEEADWRLEALKKELAVGKSNHWELRKVILVGVALSMAALVAATSFANKGLHFDAFTIGGVLGVGTSIVGLMGMHKADETEVLLTPEQIQELNDKVEIAASEIKNISETLKQNFCEPTMKKIIRIILSVAIVGAVPVHAQSERTGDAIETSKQVRERQLQLTKEEIRTAELNLRQLKFELKATGNEEYHRIRKISLYAMAASATAIVAGTTLMGTKINDLVPGVGFAGIGMVILGTMTGIYDTYKAAEYESYVLLSQSQADELNQKIVEAEKELKDLRAALVAVSGK